MNIALVGNPNSGKTTIFNKLTGAVQYVGNWPGVTVEKKTGFLKTNKTVTVVDLPGIYSISPYTMEEVITKKYIIEEKPELIVNIIDASNLERNLYLTTQLMEFNVPMVVLLNMMDIVDKKGDTINEKLLEKKLGCKVLKTSAISGNSVFEAVQESIELNGKKQVLDIDFYDKDLTEKLCEIKDILRNYNVNDSLLQFYSIKLFEKDKNTLLELNLTENDKQKINNILLECEQKHDDDGESIIITQRYSYINSFINTIYAKKSNSQKKISDKIDSIVTNKFLALPIFMCVMFAVYYISISTIGTFATDWVNDVVFDDFIPNHLTTLMDSMNTSPIIQSLILDGIIAGVGAVLGFLPQMAVLFFLLAILEDCGYMSRIAFIMDSLFRKIGLSGKSFIPILVSTGCGVPGIMSSRTIESNSERRMTVIISTFIPCSAKLPIIALLAGSLFPNNPFIAPSAYFLGILAIVCSGLILKKLERFKSDVSPFILELPEYHIPKLSNLLLHTFERAKGFVKKAGTVIFLASASIWFLNSFTFTLQFTSDPNSSMLYHIGSFIAPVFIPLGWGNWQSSVATITGLVAKENVVGTLGVLLGFGDASESNEAINSLTALFTQISAYSFLVFNLLCAPCIAAIGAIKREMNNTKWSIFAILYQTIFAYVCSFMFYQIALLVTGGTFTVLSGIGIVVTLIFVYLVCRPYKRK